MQIPCIVTVKKKTLLSYILNELTGSSGDGLFLIHSKASNLEELVKEIENNKAYLVMFEKSDPFAKAEIIVKLLVQFSKLLVVVISEESNWLNIFHREDKLLVSSADLIDSIISRINLPSQKN